MVIVSPGMVFSAICGKLAGLSGCYLKVLFNRLGVVLESWKSLGGLWCHIIFEILVKTRNFGNFIHLLL